jgi:asparaginyl-tRNA synthetase
LTQIPQYEDKLVEVRGWIHNIRTQSNIIFIELRDGTGFVQVVLAGKGLVSFHKKSTSVNKQESNHFLFVGKL